MNNILNISNPSGLIVKGDFSKPKYKILHIGLCATGKPFNGFQQALFDNADWYEEVNCSHPRMNEESVRLAYEMKPDIIFIQIQTHGIINVHTMKKLRELSGFIVNWTGDVRQDIPKWMIDVAPYLDYTLFSNMTDVRKMRELGFNSEYLEIGINPEIYKPTGNVIPVFPIVFFGNNYGSGFFPMSDFRIKLVNYMNSVFRNRFGAYGNGYDGAKGNFCGSQLDEAAAYRGAKIAINVSHFEYERYSSDRMLRILGSGVLCLAKEYPGIEQDFTDGVHLRTWKTLEELEGLCHYYLDHNNEQERQKISKVGSELALRSFTFHAMVENLIAIHNTYTTK